MCLFVLCICACSVNFHFSCFKPYRWEDIDKLYSLNDGGVRYSNFITIVISDVESAIFTQDCLQGSERSHEVESCVLFYRYSRIRLLPEKTRAIKGHNPSCWYFSAGTSAYSHSHRAYYVLSTIICLAARIVMLLKVILAELIRAIFIFLKAYIA